MQKPLISFVILCYNQENFIREAIEGALAQDYSPLEILIMDDASTDRSHEVAQQVVSEYKGPHQVRVCRNPRNGGIGKSINAAMELCRGELIIGSAGDDVSLPTRTTVIYETWENSGRRATSIFSPYTIVSEDGIVLGEGGRRCIRDDGSPTQKLTGSLDRFLTTRVPAVNGCTHAWSRELMAFFGPLNSDLEDLVLSFRTLAIGEMLYVNQSLVKYRRHGTNVSFLAEGEAPIPFERRERRLLWVDRQTVAAYDTMVDDIKTLCARGRIKPAERDSLLVEAQRIRRYYSTELQMMEQPKFISRVQIILQALIEGHICCALRYAVRILPLRLYKVLYLLRGKRRK